MSVKIYYLQPPKEKLNENERLVVQVGFGAQGFEYPPVLHDGAGGV